MTSTAIDILILLFGCAFFMGILIFALTYREIKLRKSTAEQDTKDFVAMRLYRERSNTERERKSEIKTDPNDPEFGKGWFYYIVQRDLAETNRQREQRNDKTS